MRGAIGGQRRFDRKPIGCDDGGEGLGSDQIDGPARNQEEPRLLGRRAGHEIDVRTGARHDSIDRPRGDDVAIDHRLPEHEADRRLGPPSLGVGVGHEVGLQLGLCLKEALDRDRGDRLPGRRDAELLGEPPADLSRGRRGDGLMCPAALGDRPPEQPPGAGHREQRAHAHASGRLAEDGDAPRIASERRDVLPHPLECGDLIEQTEVGGSVTEVEKALGADAVVDGHADGAVTGEAAAIVGRTGPGLEHAPGNPNHDGQPGRALLRRPDVEVQAVLA